MARQPLLTLLVAAAVLLFGTQPALTKSKAPPLPGGDPPAKSFRGQTLAKANFRGDDLRGADFSDAILRGADLTGADLRKANFDAADLSPANLLDGGAGLVARTTILAILSLALLGWGFWRVRTLRHASRAQDKAIGAGYLGIFLGGTMTLGSLVALGMTHESHLREAEMSGATFRGAKLRRVDFQNANLSRADLSGADLTQARMDLAYLDGCRLAGARTDVVSAAWSYPPGNLKNESRGDTDKLLASYPYFHFVPYAPEQRARFWFYEDKEAAPLVKRLLGPEQPVASIPDSDLDERFPALKSCRAMGSDNLRLRGTVLLYFVNHHQEDPAVSDHLLPGELRARLSDKRFTILIVEYRDDLQGTYSGGGGGYRRDQNVYAFAWPGGAPLGYFRIRGEDPPEAFFHDSHDSPGPVYGAYEKPFVMWLQALPRQWTSLIRALPREAYHDRR